MAKDDIRLVQLAHPEHKRCVAVVDGSSLILLQNVNTIYELAAEAIQKKTKISDLIMSYRSMRSVPYDSIYDGHQDWKLLPSFDHPHNPLACIVSGTGLTHKNSALSRQMMHQSSESKPTDSLVMYQWGVEGGFPSKGMIGVQPEWFYKGTGVSLRAHGEPLDVPAFGNDGGEEPEIAGVYIVDSEGNPWRIGLTTGNEFSDHVMEKKNYLYLAPSKLRQCSIGPELAIDATFDEIEGEVSIVRQGQLVWASEIKTGQEHMAYSLENLEYHHFKYPGHRVPLQAHVHFFGAAAFSFGSGIKLQDADIMRVRWNGLGRPLENSLRVSKEKETMVTIRSL